MLGNSAKRLKNWNVGDNVIIPIPSLDQRQTDHTNISCGFYKRGIKAGILTTCYAGNQSDTVTQAFMTVAEEVPEHDRHYIY